MPSTFNTRLGRVGIKQATQTFYLSSKNNFVSRDPRYVKADNIARDNVGVVQKNIYEG